MHKEPQIIHAKRAYTPEEATLLVGDLVPDREASFRGPAFIYDEDTGDLVAAHLPVQNTKPVRNILHGIKYGQFSRANNYASRSTTFGYAPRRPLLGREGCASSAIDRDRPEVQAILNELADECARALRDFAPNIVAEDEAATSEVLPEWRMGEEKLWTSGVINDTSQLPYHRDNFNFPAWSAMPVLRRGTSGGMLHLPEYNLVIPCQDGYAVYFKGKELVHGVTPIHKRQPDGYRFSIVFYALRGMKDCFTHAVETRYAQRKRSERERDMARRIANGDTTIPGHKIPNNKDGDPSLVAQPDEAESCAEAADIAQAASPSHDYPEPPPGFNN